MIHDDFTTLAVIVGVAAAAGIVANRLRQPLIVAFIAIGILAGPSGFAWVEGGDDLELFARLGIALLLFLVGLKLDVHLVRTTGPVALATGIGQVAFTAGIGYGLALLLGLDATTALYVAVAPRVVSTIPSIPATTALLHALRHHDYDGQVAVTALHERDAVHYRALGADVVLRPFTIAADATCQLLGLPADTDAATSEGTQRS